MWKAIVKGILGGVGGGLKEASETETNISKASTTNTASEDDTAKNVGMLGGKIFTKLKQKKENQKEENKEEGGKAV